MAKLFGKLRHAATRFLDPDRERRIEESVRSIEIALAAQRERFDFDGISASLPAQTHEQGEVFDTVLVRAIDKAWDDGVVSERESQALALVADLLHVSRRRLGELQYQSGLERFECQLDQVLASGTCEEAGLARLGAIALGMRSDTPTVMSHVLQIRGDGILGRLFSRAVAEGRMDRAEWDRMIHFVESLGVPRSTFASLVQPQAARFAERALADAKADGVLSDRERDTLDWIVDRFPLPPGTVDYIQSEVGWLQLLDGVRSGRLPTVRNPSVLTQAAEIVHHECRAMFFRTRRLRSGPATERYDGMLVVTDARMIFDSMERSFNVRYGRVVGIEKLRGGFSLRVDGKGSGEYVPDEDRGLCYEILKSALRRANQRLFDTTRESSVPSRHIPRDVRQRVWQEYQGKCAECGEEDFLEFDHIIPVAKGGSNAQENIQLLCRRCNGRKSDRL